MVIWIVSLCVGVSISVCGLLGLSLMCERIGSVNVVVLLVLVCVWLSMLCFFISGGMVVVWIGEGDL